jgi:putative tricarboxylic transport membrane protein
MHLVEKWAATILALVAASVIWQSATMELYADLGPGPGFFPLCLGIILFGLSASWLVSVVTTPSPEGADRFLPDRAAQLRILSVVGGVVVIASAMTWVGFQLAMFFFVVFTLIALGRRDWLRIIAIALFLSFGIYYAFVQWLDVNLPSASIPFLRDLNL